MQFNSTINSFVQFNSTSLNMHNLGGILPMNYDKFAALCKKKGTTPTSLTLSMGLSKGNASSWKKSGNPSVDVLIKLADFLECSTDYLLDRTDNPEINK